jgi:sugar phosphate isomerase/epimerase
MYRPTRRDLFAAPVGLLLAQKLSALPLASIKLGVTTDEIHDDVLTASKFLREHGLKWAEVRNIWGPYNTAQPIEKVREAARIFDENGIRVSIEGTGFFKIPLPAETPEGQQILDKQWALLDGALERAKVFGTDKLRVFSFTFGRGEGPASEKTLARIHELMREAARRAKGYRLAIENVGGAHVETGAQLAALLKHVKEDNIGATWDPNNAGAAGEQSYPEGYGKLDPARIFHVHLRDYKKGPDGKVGWAAVGDGEFDNLGQIRALLKAGYKEAFTLETHWQSPKGKMFATETSLAGLLKVIEKV